MTRKLCSLARHSASFLALVALLAATSCGDADPARDAAKPGSQSDLPVDSTTELTPSEEVLVLTKALQPELPPEIRMFAAAQLVAIGTPDTVGPLTDAMRDEDERVAIVAVEGLPATKDGAAISALEELAESGPEKVSAAAKRRLSTLQ